MQISVLSDRCTIYVDVRSNYVDVRRSQKAFIPPVVYLILNVYCQIFEQISRRSFTETISNQRKRMKASKQNRDGSRQFLKTIENRLFIYSSNREYSKYLGAKKTSKKKWFNEMRSRRRIHICSCIIAATYQIIVVKYKTLFANSDSDRIYTR